MGLALKKHLSKMELSSNDIVIFSVPQGAKDEEWRGFAEGLAEDLKTNHGITTPLLIIRPGFNLGKLDDETLAEFGLVRKLTCEHPEDYLSEFGCDTGDWKWCSKCGAMSENQSMKERLANAPLKWATPG